MYPSGYTQDTSQYIRIRILITTPPKLDNKPPLTRLRRDLPSRSLAPAMGTKGGGKATAILNHLT
jgi:hypothetical protein